ncbi:hypothetical protein ACHAWO_000070 [Cyclotella atomus]|uniref:tRNA(Ile)-lysidine/2-thiocytidine synthase N-terminal domain-containing protein n=1 Tax=Cyclotella atomus TaxID=382360 RepID=A0ABD3QKJ4_9STRA
MGSKKQPRNKPTSSSQNTSSGGSTQKSLPPLQHTSNTDDTNIPPPSDDQEDFCQRFFGDPLFSNLNVALLFLLATFLPMLVWIPHVIHEYAKLRQSTLAEGERLKRMEQSRIDLIHPTDHHDTVEHEVLRRMMVEGEVIIQTPFSEDDVAVFEEDVFGIKSDSAAVGAQDGEASSLLPRKPVVLPKLCPDGRTMGFDNWFTLRDAISEANSLAAEDFLRWNKYLVMSLEDPELEEPIFPIPDPFVICPGAKLNQRHPPRQSLLAWLTSFVVQEQKSIYKPSKNKLSSIFINAEDITIECDRCLVDLPGTHFSFGPHARNVWIKNNPIGSINMEGGNIGGTMNAGCVADVNSTSSVTFYRCSIDDHKHGPRRANVGAEPNDRIMVCVSGGKDSATLLHLLMQMQNRLASIGTPFDLVAVHLNQMQPGYDGRPLIDWLDKLGVEYQIVTEDTYSIVTDKTPENKAYCSLCSRLRRGILYSIAHELGCNKIALGHHGDDAMQTLLLNMIHGGSMKAIPARYFSSSRNVHILRPLITCTESDIAEFAKQMKFPILPCNLCGSQDDLHRGKAKLLVDAMESMNPNARRNVIKSLGNVRPSHLLDENLRDACGLDRVTGSVLDEDRARLIGEAKHDAMSSDEVIDREEQIGGLEIHNPTSFIESLL